jgi:hypothetical protein
LICSLVLPTKQFTCHHRHSTILRSDDIISRRAIDYNSDGTITALVCFLVFPKSSSFATTRIRQSTVLISDGTVIHRTIADGNVSIS